MTSTEYENYILSKIKEKTYYNILNELIYNIKEIKHKEYFDTY